MTDTLPSVGRAPIVAPAPTSLEVGAPEATATGIPEARAAKADRHLWQIDVVRLLTFAAVISVHCLAFTTLPDDGVAAGAMMILQFGREVFFSITGFVLIYASFNRPMHPIRFWRKRFFYVGVPYLAWSAIYYGYSLTNGPHAPASWHNFAIDLFNGNAEYHLYFLLVSMQLYLVFPLVLKLVRATAHRPWPVIAVVGVLNAAWLGAIQWAPWPSGWTSVFFSHGYELLPTYAIYVLLGCYAAVHRDHLLELLRANRRRVVAFAVAALTFTEVAYAIQAIWMPVRSADSPVQPVMILGSIATVLLLVMVADAWALSRQPAKAAVKRGSEISFGVYLCHPLVLAVLCNAGLGNGRNHLFPGLAVVLAYVGTVTGAVLIANALRTTPVALPLIGRARARGGIGPLTRVRCWLGSATPLTSNDVQTAPTARPVQPFFRSH